MTEVDLSAFLDSCAAYRAGTDDLRALGTSNEEAWAQNDWRRAHEAYWTIRSMLPSSIAYQEAWMAEHHPEKAALHDAIRTHADRHRAMRAQTMERSAELRRRALTELGAAMAPSLL